MKSDNCFLETRNLVVLPSFSLIIRSSTQRCPNLPIKTEETRSCMLPMMLSVLFYMMLECNGKGSVAMPPLSRRIWLSCMFCIRQILFLHAVLYIFIIQLNGLVCKQLEAPVINSEISSKKRERK